MASLAVGTNWRSLLLIHECRNECKARQNNCFQFHTAEKIGLVGQENILSLTKFLKPTGKAGAKFGRLGQETCWTGVVTACNSVYDWLTVSRSMKEVKFAINVYDSGMTADLTFNFFAEALKNILSRPIGTGWATVCLGTGTKQLFWFSLNKLRICT